MSRPRTTIGRWMVAVAVVAGLLGLCRAIGWDLVRALAFLSGAIGVAGLIVWAGWRVARTRRRIAFWGLIGTSILISLPAAWLCIHPVRTVGPLLVVVWLLVSAPPLLGFLAAWTFGSHPPSSVRMQTLVWLFAALPWSMITGWPLIVAFFVVRPSLERLADQITVGVPVTFPRQVGPFTILAAKCDPAQPRTVALMVHNDPNGPAGFVRQVGPPPDFNHKLILSTGFRIPLTSEWDYRNED